MSFRQADFSSSNLPQDLWSNPYSLVSASTKTLGSSKAPRTLDLSIMDNVLADRPLALSQYPNPEHYDGRRWYDAFPAHDIPQSQDASYDFGQGQYTGGGNFGNAGPMLHFQGNMMVADQRHFQGQQHVPAAPKKSNQYSKRRSRPPKDPRDGPAQKRKRTTKAAACDYLNGATCGDECNSTAGSSETCCSSCSDGMPCADPHCAIPCAESTCEKPICPEDCPISTGPQGQQIQFHQGFVPSSERLSFLQQTNAEPWNPVGSRTSPSIKEAYIHSAIDPALTDPELNSQYDPQPQSPSPPTPSMAQNMATPYSPEASLQTPHFMGQGSQVVFSNESSAVIGAGGMFNSPMDDWPGTFANTGHDPLTSNCGWYGCDQLIPNEIFWQHLHQAHVDPQISYPCPLQSNDCPTTLGTNALNHLQTQHGFDMNESFSCPAPTCSPAETYNDPAMFHNHFDQAHAVPAQGFLHCRLYSCNGSFLDPNQLLSHITQSHQLPVSPPKMAIDAMKTEASNYPLSIPENEELVEHNCKWKLGGGIVCGEVCGTEKDLQDHVKIKHLTALSKHTGYICKWENCNRPAKMGDKQGFSQRGKLERHMASHTNCKSHR